MRLLWSLAAVLAAFIAGVKISHHRGTEAGAKVRTVLYYEDPMHPAYRSPRPGKAPDCGMDLVPVYNDSPTAADHNKSVYVSPETARLIGIQTAVVTEGSVENRLHTVGRVAAAENRVFPVITKTEGTVRELYGAVTGTIVRQGDPLAGVYSRDIQVAQRGYIFALDNMDRVRASGAPPRPEQTQSTLDEARLNLLNLGMSERQIAGLMKQRQIDLVTELAAPASGVIVSRGAFPDQRYERGMELFRIADLSIAWIYAELFSEDAALVWPGREATITLDARPGVKIHARVSDSLQLADAASRTYKVRLEATNSSAILLPDMVVEVEFLSARKTSLLVPRGALLESGTRTIVFVERESGRFDLREVTAGRYDGEMVEIRHGLKTGDRVASSGLFLLDSESRLRTNP